MDGENLQFGAQNLKIKNQISKIGRRPYVFAPLKHAKCAGARTARKIQCFFATLLEKKMRGPPPLVRTAKWRLDSSRFSYVFHKEK